MKWKIEKSNELKVQIASNKELLSELSHKLAEIFRKYEVDLGDKSYIFEPRVFALEDTEMPELAVKSREALLTAVIGDLYKKGIDQQYLVGEVGELLAFCPPQCGGMDPFHLAIIEKYRITELAAEGVIRNGDDLMKKIVGNKELLHEMSHTVFGILEQYGIKFGEKEGCVFTPFVFDKPIYAQKIAETSDINEMRGFGPRVFNGGVNELRPQPIPPGAGYIQFFNGDETVFLPAVIAKHWWWEGIPAPEILAGIEMMNQWQYNFNYN